MERTTKPNHRQAGFTLLELIVVLTMLAVAAALFAPSVLQRTRASATTAFAEELTELVEGIKRYHWANGVFPPDAASLLSFMGMTWPDDWPQPPIGGTLTYTSGTTTATLSISGVTGSRQKYLSIVDRIVPFSSCTVSSGTCTITVPATSIYIDQEIQAAAVLSPGDAAPAVTCPTGMSPQYLVSVLLAEDPAGYGMAGFRAWEDGGVVHLEVRSVSGALYTDPADAKLLVLAFCH